MNKSNKLLVGILAFVVVCVIGYALFSETITVTGTATAKGNFEITTVCEPGIGNDLINLGMASSVDDLQAGFDNSTCAVSDNVVTMTTELLYPTATRYFTIKMENTGSMPAIIWGDNGDELVESFDISKGSSYALKKIVTDEIVKSGVGRFIWYTNSGETFVTLLVIITNEENNMIEEVIYDNTNAMAGIKLNPGDKLYALVNFVYPKHADIIMSDNGNSEYFEFKLNHEFKWEQFVDSSNYETANIEDFCFMGC